MEQKFKVVLSYLKGLSAMTVIPDDQKSKEDPAKQTRAVEKLVKSTITTRLPEFSDKVFSVGGHVRDSLLGKNPKDLDLVVDDPQQKMKSAEIFAKKFTDVLGITTANNPHPLKEAYGIWGVVLFNPKSSGGSREPFVYDDTDLTGYIIELTPPRKEGPYDFQKREPQYVEYTSRAEDSKRRDLTVNALYRNVATGEIEDHVGGMEDLKNHTLRPPEHPEGIQKIYEEDPLRILRLIRFKGKLPGFTISAGTEKVVKDFLKSSEGQKVMQDKLSKERIRDEFQNILTHPNAKAAVEGMESLKDFGLLKYISPELEKLFDVYHDTVFHKGESVWQHTMEVLAGTPPTPKARLAALFHDIGKIETVEKATDAQGRDRVHFKGHEDVSYRMVSKIMQELKYPIDITKSIQNIVSSHMGFKNVGQQKSDTQLKRMRIFIEKLHEDMDDAIALLKADAVGDAEELRGINELETQLKKQKQEDIDKGLLVQKDKGMEYISPLSGDDLMKEYESLKGPALGAVKNRLKQMLMEGRFENLDEKQRAEKAKKLVKGLTVDEKQLAAVLDKYQKSIKNRSFYSVK